MKAARIIAWFFRCFAPGGAGFAARVRPWNALLILIALVCFSAPIEAQLLSQFVDGVDAVVRRTDAGNDGPFDTALHALPELLEIRLGEFDPDEPWDDRFDGIWQGSGGFLRCDLVFAGLINPPGPLGWDDENPEYDPYRFGGNPVFGYIEFDVDEDENTGGELSAPDLRYTGNAARFGGLPHASRLAGRVAENAYAFDADVLTPPFVDRSGEEFHLALIGEYVEEIDVRHESPGGDPDVFEPGETWDIEGEFFHRAHGFEAFEFRCFWNPGSYEPEVMLRFSHDLMTDETTVSLVYPLRNSSAARHEGPTAPVESADGCDDNQNSILEALQALKFSAINADPSDRLLPEFELIAGWEFNSFGTVLDIERWRVLALVGSAYEVYQADGARFVWTDVYPNPVHGDFDGDAIVNPADLAALNAFIASHDADPMFDSDGQVNGILALVDFATGFCLFDADYDGQVSEADGVLKGDLDLDLSLDMNDVDDFVQALVSPQAYSATHGGADPVPRGDFNGDAKLDGQDIPFFVDAILMPSMQPFR